MRGAREHRYDLGDGPTVDDLAAALSPIGRLAPASACSGVVSLTFYDTAGLALADAGITLRRGEGAGDAGWQVDLPRDAAGAGAEYWLPLRAGDGVPGDVEALVARHVTTGSLRPVAQVRIAREAFELLGPGGEALARLADERAVALRARDGAASSWRELAVSPLRGGATHDDEIAQALCGIGAAVSPHASALARVLADRPVRAKRRSDPLVAWLATQLGALLRAEPGVRDGDAEAIHDMRIATRKLRTCLSTFSAAYEPGALDDLAADLAELGRLLGAARDADVLAGRLEADLAGVPALQVLGPVRAVIRAHGAREAASARRALGAYLDGPGYPRLLERLAAAVADPPLAHLDRSRGWYRAQIGVTERRVERLVARAAATAGDEHEVALHAVRKAAKRARYAIEAAAPVLGTKRARRAAGYARLQEALGEHQDAVVARAFLREEGARAGVRAGENGFTYGLLYAREDALAASAEARFAKRWRKLARQRR